MCVKTKNKDKVRLFVIIISRLQLMVIGCLDGSVFAWYLLVPPKHYEFHNYCPRNINNMSGISEGTVTSYLCHFYGFLDFKVFWEVHWISGSVKCNPFFLVFMQSALCYLVTHGYPMISFFKLISFEELIVIPKTNPNASKDYITGIFYKNIFQNMLKHIINHAIICNRRKCVSWLIIVSHIEHKMECVIFAFTESKLFVKGVYR